VVADPEIESTYYVRETPAALWRQYHNYGMGKASTLAKHGTLPTWRPLAPAALVAAAAVGLLFKRYRLGVPLLHALVCAVVARRLVRRAENPPDALRTFTAIEICHWAYGLGFWRGVLRIVRGKGFDQRPRRGR
jgi:succinoglycan biosynthesis protein ExoA